MLAEKWCRFLKQRVSRCGAFAGSGRAGMSQLVSAVLCSLDGGRFLHYVPYFLTI